PVETIRDYHTELAGYTKGKGRLSCMLDGYKPCRNPEKAISEIGYNCDEDTENTADSIFCKHGAGFLVKWNEVENYMHLESCLKQEKTIPEPPTAPISAKRYSGSLEEDKELMQIFERTYGKINRDERQAFHKAPEQKTEYKSTPPKKGEYLIVDGYNIIFSWDELKKQSAESLDLARNTLINRLCNYQGFRKCKVILVFDAYKVKGNSGSYERVNNIDVVYTKESETADSYIEKISHELVRDYRVRVATSDNLEQMIILGNGAYRISSQEFLEEMKNTEREIAEYAENFSHKKSGGQ
ncbi:MAG: NYN domain-containing protein, partial [Ruminococcus sp.]